MSYLKRCLLNLVFSSGALKPLSSQIQKNIDKTPLAIKNILSTDILDDDGCKKKQSSPQNYLRKYNKTQLDEKMSYQRLVFQMMMIARRNSLHHENVLHKRELLPLSVGKMVIIGVLNLVLGMEM